MTLKSNVVAVVASEHPINAVTIFQSSTAEVMRDFTVSLQNGRNVVEISGISDSLDPESPRVHGLGEDARLFDIVCNTAVSQAPRGRGTQNAEELRRLRARRAVMEAECRLRHREAELLDNAASVAAKREDFKLDDMNDLLRRKGIAQKAVLGLQEEISELDREVWLLDRKRVGKSETVITATFVARRDCQVGFRLSYLVAGASWSPTYDLHASTVDGHTSPTVSLVYGANVTQKTGEEWNNVALTLSTATSQALKSLSIPALPPLKLAAIKRATTSQNHGYQSPVTMSIHAPFASIPSRTAYSESSSLSPDPTPIIIQPQGDYWGRSSAVAIPRPPDPARAEPVKWGANAPGNAATILDGNPLALAYHIQGDAPIPSDGLAHRVAIATLSLEAELKYVCVPKMNKSAFIEASVKNTSEYELLAGPVGVFMDGGFVTKTTLGLIAINQAFECVLGIDTALRVLSYTTESRTMHEAARSFAEASKKTTHTARITVLNGHTFDVDGIVVRDVLPHGDADAKILVTLQKPEGLALAKDGEEVAQQMTDESLDVKARWTKVEDGKGGEKDGMFEWVCGVGAGKKLELEAEWDIKTPGALEWEEKTANK